MVSGNTVNGEANDDGTTCVAVVLAQVMA